MRHYFAFPVSRLLPLLMGATLVLLHSCLSEEKKASAKVESVLSVWVEFNQENPDGATGADLPLDTTFSISEVTRNTPFFDVFLINESDRQRLLTGFGVTLLSGDSARVLFHKIQPAEEVVLFSPWERKRLAIQPRLDSLPATDWDSNYICRFDLIFDDSTRLHSEDRIVTGIDLLVIRNSYGQALVDGVQALDLYRQPESSAKDQGIRLLALSEIDSVYKRHYVNESLRSDDYFVSTAAAWCAANLGWTDLASDIQQRMAALEADSLTGLVTVEVREGRSQGEVDALLSEAKDEWMEAYCQALGNLGKPCRK